MPLFLVGFWRVVIVPLHFVQVRNVTNHTNSESYWTMVYATQCSCWRLIHRIIRPEEFAHSFIKGNRLFWMGSGLLASTGSSLLPASIHSTIKSSPLLWTPPSMTSNTPCQTHAHATSRLSLCIQEPRLARDSPSASLLAIISYVRPRLPPSALAACRPHATRRRSPTTPKSFLRRVLPALLALLRGRSNAAPASFARLKKWLKTSGTGTSK